MSDKESVYRHLLSNAKEEHKVIEDLADTAHRSEVSLLKLRIEELEYQIKLLKERLYRQSWEVNPDRSGGAFTDWERENANKW